MCFGIRFSSPFHSATQIISIQNLNCLNNAKTNAWTWSLSQHLEVIKAWAWAPNFAKFAVQTLSRFHAPGRFKFPKDNWLFRVYIFMKMADVGYGCVMHSTFMEENYTFMEEHSTFMENHSQNHVTACVFCVFSAVYIMNGCNLSGQMKRAWNSDSKTHVKKQNPTSRTEISRRSLKYLRDTLYWSMIWKNLQSSGVQHALCDPWSVLKYEVWVRKPLCWNGN